MNLSEDILCIYVQCAERSTLSNKHLELSFERLISDSVYHVFVIADPQCHCAADVHKCHFVLHKLETLHQILIWLSVSIIHYIICKDLFIACEAG